MTAERDPVALLEAAGIPRRAQAAVAEEALTVRAMRRQFASFFRANEPSDPYFYGRHTRGLVRIYQKIVERLEAGESSYVIVNIPPQHGKSDVISRAGPAWTLLRRPETKIVLATYGKELASDMSLAAKRLFRKWAPSFGLRLARKMKARPEDEAERDQVTTWGTTRGGYLRAVGIHGAATGRTGEIIIIDDPFKDRQEADSDAICRKVWDAFGHVFMTRRAPVHAVLIVMNRWRDADLCGRILAANDPESSDYNDKLPIFEPVTFPAHDEERGYLFPERYSEPFYESARAFAGSYGWNSQYQQDPQPRSGNLFKMDRVIELEPEEFERRTKDLIFEWGLDLASSEKELSSDDPDWTHGSEAGVDLEGKAPALYLREVFRTRETAIDRNRTVRRHVTRSDSDRMRVESVAGYKDAFITLKTELEGLLVVAPVHVKTSLFSRAGILEPVIEAGNFYVPKGAPWLKEWYEEMRAFPNGRHDDAIASLLASVYDRLRGARMKIET